MFHALRFIHQPQPSGRTSSLLALMACTLVSIRLLADVICATCFNEIERPPVRSFHLHAGGDREGCHHGRAQPSPLVEWACSVTQDDSAYVLPEVPRLLFLVSALALFTGVVLSWPTTSLIAAVGRGPPFFSS